MTGVMLPALRAGARPLAVLPGSGPAGQPDPVLWRNQPNPQAVRQVLSKQRSAANAAWWGFHASDSTAALQAAFDSGAKKLLIPFMGEPWITRPLHLRANQEVTFAPGVLLLAKRGEFRGKRDSLLSADGLSNLTLRGYGATLRMWKRDYQHVPYEKAEWRMGVALRGCKKVLIEGVRVESTGGDGFYVDEGGGRLWSEDIVIRNCVADDNHRQGISVISAVNLLLENCTFSNTGGTAPEAGIDLEPDAPNQRLVNCVIRNSRFENNRGHQMLVYLRQFNSQTVPVSIRFENCLARTSTCAAGAPGEKPGGYSAMAVGAIKDNGPQGSVEFDNCTAANACKSGALIYDKSAKSARVRFVNCSWSHPWMAGAETPANPEQAVLVELRRPALTEDYGGIDFIECDVEDTADRPAIAARALSGKYHVRDLRGEIMVRNPFGAKSDFGPQPAEVSLRVEAAGRTEGSS